MTHCHHLVALFSVPPRPECYVENTRGRILTEMNDPITLLSGFKASVSVWRTGHMTTRLTHMDRTGWRELDVVVGGEPGMCEHSGEQQRQC